MPVALGTVASHRTVTATGPIPTTGLVGWWDADDASTFSYLSGSIVSEWRDKSGQNHHVTQSDTQRQPWRNATINGRAVVNYSTSSGLSQSLAIPAGFASGFTSAELFLIVRVNNESAGGAPLGRWTSEGQLTHYPYVPDIYETWGTTTRRNLGNPTPALTDPHLYNVQTAPGSYVAQINAAPFYSTAVNTVGFHPSIGVVHEIGQKDDSFKFIGDIAEVVMYNRVLSSGERTQVESYLKTKWGTP